ncbi:hypothetical protein B0H13DRAFT_1943151 [Mycena leptocephala]|nr:hypothetical protein B0H13DRAFT_1943151 [Mycena leptocephala]
MASLDTLIHRFRVLHRIRSRTDSGARPGSAGDGDSVHELLFHAYLMMLENAGKNEQQLRDYAKMGDWLTTHVEHWPPQNEHTSLAMWLFWFLLRPDDYTIDDDSTWNVLNVLKIYALGAHKYPLTDPSWVNFLPEYPQHPISIVRYSEAHQLKTPPLATPAILHFSSHLDLPMKPESNEWEYELGRCRSLSRPEFDNGLTQSFRPGRWGKSRCPHRCHFFQYTEFTAYAALLQGAPPPILQKSVIVRHRQTWKLREHHFVVGTEPVPSRVFPTGTQIIESRDGVEVRDPNRPTELRYYRSALGPNIPAKDKHDDDCSPQVQGHSAWGQFNLVGRVRPCDGFISLCKEYVDHDRGKWIYRGYLVGNINSNLAGRWRDTLSPAAVPGYEGCFLMTRRR